MRTIELWQVTSMEVGGHEDGTVTLLAKVGNRDLATISVLNSLSCLLGVDEDEVDTVETGNMIFESPALMQGLLDIFEQARLTLVMSRSDAPGQKSAVA